MNKFLKIVLGGLLVAVLLTAYHIFGNTSQGGATTAAPYAAVFGFNAPNTVPPVVGPHTTQGGALRDPKEKPLFFIRRGSDPIPEIPTEIYGIWDLASGDVYAEKSAYIRWPLASLTKLMAAVSASVYVPQESMVPLQSSVLPQDQVNMFQLPTGVYRASDLMHAMLIGSRNEAAEALAAAYGREEFIKAMNAQALAWGMQRTYFEEPSGLSVVNQGTADDLRKLAEHIWNEYPEIFQITRSTAWMVHPEKEMPVVVQSTNGFVARGDFLGGKTGYIDESQGNLLTLFRYEERPILIVVMGAEDRFKATETLYDWFVANFTRS